MNDTKPPAPSLGRPLSGERVVVTRAADQANSLVELLEKGGARVERLPLLEIVPPTDPIALERAASELPLFQWLVLTSANTVRALLPLTGGSLPPGLRVAVVGEKTAAELERYEVRVDLIPTTSSAEGLAEALAPHLGRRERVLLPQAADARPVLGDKLTAAGAEVVRVCAYEKRIPSQAQAEAQRIFADGTLGWVTFTSPSTVRGLVEVLAGSWEERKATLRALSIGKVTSEELRRQEVPQLIEATRPSEGGLVEALERALPLERIPRGT